MNEFEQYFGDEFFVIDSYNLNNINQSFYGFTIENNKLIQKCDIKKDMDLNGFGAYIFVKVDSDTISISQDYVGSYGLYLYKTEDYFAISNSFIKLVEYLKDFKNISFNKKFADAFMLTHYVSLAYNQTLVNEISLIPRNCKIIINKLNKNLTLQKIDYQEETVPIDSKEGMLILDNWYWKWIDIFRLLKTKTNNIEVDLSGGFDSRIVAAIWLTANIDLNKILIKSSTAEKHEEDFEIASEIAKKFNFRLNNYGMRPLAIPFKDMNTIIKISFYIKLGFHKEMYFKNIRYEEPMYYFSGSSGGTLRNIYDNTPEEYSASLLNYIGNLSKELIPSSEEIITDSLKKIKNEFDIYDDNSKLIPERFYKENNNRHHFGKDLVENYFGNLIKLGPLMDSELQKLKLTTNECEDRYLLFALIFQRYCPELLEFKIQGNRKIDKNTLYYAKKINEKYPFAQKSMEFISGPELTNFNNNAIIPGLIKSDAIINFLKGVYTSRLFEMEFKKYYSSDIYYTILRNMTRTNIHSHPLRHVYAAIAMLKIIHDTNYKTIDDKNWDSWLKSFINSETTEDIPPLMFGFLNKYITARIDIKNFGHENNSIEIISNNDIQSKESFPKWFENDEGKGLVVHSTKCSLNLTIKCINEGSLKLWLRGPDIRDNENKRFPVFIDYTNLMINGKQYLSGNKLVWHDKPYLFEKKVHDKEIIDIYIGWKPFSSSSIYTK